MAYGMLSRLFMLTSRPHESIAWGEKALHLAEPLGDDDVRANALNNIGVSLVLLGEIQRGIDFLERSLELAKQVGASVFTTGRAYINLGAQLLLLGEFKRAAEVAREGIAFHHDLGLDPDLEWRVLGSAELELGQWDRAHELLDRAIRAGELGIPTARLQALPIKAELLLRQGRLDEARRLESALSECEKLGDRTDFGSFASALARVHLALGDLDQAIVVMDRGVAACRAIGPLVGTEPTLG
ncbi:MAG TPA: tetratricopeptide repeat protein, partial [Roseiflexaceae bacterium]